MVTIYLPGRTLNACPANRDIILGIPFVITPANALCSNGDMVKYTILLIFFKLPNDLPIFYL